MAYKDPKSNERIGFNVDLVERLAKEIGVSVEWEEMSFEQLMTSLTTGRIDMIGTAISDLPSRREKLTFVDYLVTGAQPFTTSEKKGAIKTEARAFAVRLLGAPRTTNYYPVSIAWSEEIALVQASLQRSLMERQARLRHALISSRAGSMQQS